MNEKIAYRIFVTMCCLIGLLPIGLVFIGVGIFVNGGKTEPWGELAALCITTGLLCALFVGFWSEDDGWPEKPMKLSRAGKKELRKQQDRLILNQSIARLESELRD